MSFRFLKFKVYQDSKKLHTEIVQVTKTFPREFFYLRDQLRRSSLSAALQIAEGSAKRSDKDFNRYIEISMGSANETAAGLDIAFEQSLIEKRKFESLVQLCKEVVNQLGGLSKKLLVGS